MSIVLVTNKAALYITKDNLNSINQIAKIGNLQIQALQKLLNKGQKIEEGKEDVIGNGFDGDLMDSETDGL